MFWADQIGLDNVLADIKKFEAEYGGDIWKPAPCLKNWWPKVRTCKPARVASGQQRPLDKWDGLLLRSAPNTPLRGPLFELRDDRPPSEATMAARSLIKIQGIHHVSINVNDIEAALEFLRKHPRA